MVICGVYSQHRRPGNLKPSKPFPLGMPHMRWLQGQKTTTENYWGQTIVIHYTRIRNVDVQSSPSSENYFDEFRSECSNVQLMFEKLTYSLSQKTIIIIESIPQSSFVLLLFHSSLCPSVLPWLSLSSLVQPFSTSSPSLP